MAYAFDDDKSKRALTPVATSGNYNDLTGKPDLKAVATSGDYDDLTNKPNFKRDLHASWSLDDDPDIFIAGSYFTFSQQDATANTLVEWVSQQSADIPGYTRISSFQVYGWRNSTPPMALHSTGVVNTTVRVKAAPIGAITTQQTPYVEAYYIKNSLLY